MASEALDLADVNGNHKEARETKHRVIATIGTYHSRYHASVLLSDRELLKASPRKPLSANLVDFRLWTLNNRYWETLGEREGEVCMLPASVWRDFEQSGSKVHQPKTAECPLRSKFIFLPVTILGQNAMDAKKPYWVLVVIFNAPGLLLQLDSPGPDSTPAAAPTAFILDTTGAHKQPKLEKSLRALLSKMSSHIGQSSGAVLDPKALRALRMVYPLVRGIR